MTRRRLEAISDSTLRSWLRALEACPRFVPFVPDLRIAVRNELWHRDQGAELERAWISFAVKEWNA